MLAALSADADLDQLLLDAAIVRAHQHAAGARLVTGGAQAQGLGRSRGGPTTQIHAACDGLGNPVRPPFEPGQRNDVPQAHAVIEGLAPEAGIADKGWDADPSHDAVLDAGTEPVIPPRRHRRHRRRPPACEWDLDEERNRIERFFNKPTQFRRVATRYDKRLAAIAITRAQIVTTAQRPAVVSGCVGRRIDWTYLLGLALTDSGFDASVLSAFCSRLVVGGVEALL
jgi:putative transposase